MEFLYVLTPKGECEFVLTVFQKRPGMTNLVVYESATIEVSEISDAAFEALDTVLLAVPTAPLF